jgi:GntR family transcriptional repressor for pyruvate dehydrogenase complex
VNGKRRAVIEKLLDEMRIGDMSDENGKLPSERDISKILGENRTIVREALISLEAMGIIEIRERQGIFVSTKGEDDAKYQFLKSRQWPTDMVSRALEMRQLIDPAAAAISSMRRSDEDVEKMRLCLANMQSLISDPSDEASKAGAYWNTVYHSIIVASTGNSYLTKIYEGILEGIENAMYLMRAGTKPFEGGGRLIAFEEHKKIFDTINEKNCREAERLAEKHLSHTIDAMINLGMISQVSNLYQQKITGILRFDI